VVLVREETTPAALNCARLRGAPHGIALGPASRYHREGAIVLEPNIISFSRNGAWPLPLGASAARTAAGARVNLILITLSY